MKRKITFSEYLSQVSGGKVKFSPVSKEQQATEQSLLHLESELSRKGEKNRQVLNQSLLASITEPPCS